ncbi:hypothetical protein [Anaeromyxobacter oryzae]|uniref:Uncharacterized protein n=1 Tax=Anaeromyxobacter oryzae TaxID=2918170 RepID=A0ABM7WSY9_9BACT|nr:hypothetical protein [Anaeromyxobacter oryzae]BDG02580.1 hypothetical protein AMOR_15760 [Anaeromyxobacter oryzae]
MTTHVYLAIAALAGSGLLFFTAQGRALPAIALLASGLEVVQVMGWLRVDVAGLNLGLILALLLAIPGLVAWFRAAGKPAITAAAIVTFIGIVQVVERVRLRH